MILGILLVTLPDLSILQIAPVPLLRLFLDLKSSLAQWLPITLEVLDRQFLQRSLEPPNRISLHSRTSVNLCLIRHQDLITTTGIYDLLK
jgi:hypothetical protein